MSNIIKQTSSDVVPTTGSSIAGRNTTQPGPARDNIKDAEFTVVAEELMGDMRGRDVRVSGSKGAFSNKRLAIGAALFMTAVGAFSAGMSYDGKTIRDPLASTPPIEYITSVVKDFGLTSSVKGLPGVTENGAAGKLRDGAGTVAADTKPSKNDAAQTSAAKTGTGKADSVKTKVDDQAAKSAKQSPGNQDAAAKPQSSLNDSKGSDTRYQVVRERLKAIGPLLKKYLPAGTTVTLRYGGGIDSTTIGSTGNRQSGDLTDAAMSRLSAEVLPVLREKFVTPGTLVIETNERRHEISIAGRQMTQDDAVSMMQNYRQKQAGLSGPKY